MLAAIAGSCMPSNYGTVQHSWASLPGLKAFTAAVFGASATSRGGGEAAMLLGLISHRLGLHGHADRRLLGNHYSEIFAFIVLIIILTLRPSGPAGRARGRSRLKPGEDQDAEKQTDRLRAVRIALPDAALILQQFGNAWSASPTSRCSTCCWPSG